MRLFFGVLLAVVSACALNWGFFVQHGVAASLPPLSVRRPLRSLRALSRAAGGCSDTPWASAAGVCTSWRCRLLPCRSSKRQAAAASGCLGFLVFRARRERPSRREGVGVAAAMAGLALLGVSLIHQSSSPHPVPALGAALWIGLSLIAVGALMFGVRSGAAFGAGAGLLYASGDIATKAAFASAHHLEFIVALLACHGLGFVALQRGFQLGDALQTAGLSTMLTNSVPIAAGIAIFHDGMPVGVLGIVRGAAFGLVLFAAVVLARAPVEAAIHPVEQPATAAIG